MAFDSVYAQERCPVALRPLCMANGARWLCDEEGWDNEDAQMYTQLKAEPVATGWCESPHKPSGP